MSVSQITKFEFDGVSGLEEWEKIPASELVEGDPVQRGHYYYNNEETGLSAGVWDCTAMTTKMEPYSVNEFMHVLEGGVTMVHEDGSELHVSAGESFIIPKGTVCSWKQTGYIRKFFVIFNDESGAKADDPSALRAVKVDTSAALRPAEIPDPSIFKGGVPTQHEHTIYADPTGQFIVGLWQSTPFERAVGPFNRCELMLPLEGHMTLSGDGTETSFGPGDAPFVPEGAPCGWRSEETVKKIYCIFMRKQAAAASADAAE